MRVSRQKLIDLALDEVHARAEVDYLISAYLIGSITTDAPIFGGTADVDLVLIHDDEVTPAREYVRLSNEFHLDIVHHPHTLYLQPTELRINPWLGPAICEPIFLHDPQHFFERAQAGVRGQFHRSDFAHQRALQFLQRARQHKQIDSSDWLKGYVLSCLEALNALVTLNGFPVAGRRLALILETRLQELDLEPFYARFLHLLGAPNLNQDQPARWIEEWQKTTDQASEADERFSLFRQNYHLQGFKTLVENNQPAAILWNLLRTWDSAIRALEAAHETSDFRVSWNGVLTSLKLDDSHRMQRSEELEQFLDDIEGIIEREAGGYGGSVIERELV